MASTDDDRSKAKNPNGQRGQDPMNNPATRPASDNANPGRGQARRPQPQGAGERYFAPGEDGECH